MHRKIVYDMKIPWNINQFQGIFRYNATLAFVISARFFLHGVGVVHLRTLS